MQLEIRRVQRQVGITTLYVTHDQTEAMTMSDRIVVFNRGQIEQVGAPLDVYARPSSRFAATFIGDSNILNGKVSRPGELMIAGGALVRTVHDLIARGSEGSLLVRPEDIRIGQPPDDQSSNALKVRVVSLLNMGSGVLVIAQHESGDWRIRTSLSVLSSMREGASLPIWWPAECSWPIPTDLE
jgi:putative spermidine/putrescine transport system ATP-binding protein